MQRPLVTLLVALLAAVGLVGGASWVTKTVCRAGGQPADDLDWLRTEFHVSSEQLAHIRQLHNGYKPKCMLYCNRIAELRSQLNQVLRNQGPDAPEVAQLLEKIGDERARCQADMLKHFVEVSRAMAPEEGKRYLAEMERLTIFAHESFETNMTSGTAADHVHDH